ncbi:MAG: B12-binding domain-containing radical SAM protein [Magnetococcales bacterium]|nr:B12-binding domain-containing radical SAM protein [Magnetococcales bacterium]
MSGSRVVLIFPVMDDEKAFHHLPVSLLSLAAPLADHGVEYDLWDQRVESVDRLKGLLDQCFLVGLSMFTGLQTANAHALLGEIRASHPHVLTVVGGPHISALPQQTVEDPLVDFAVAGFAEASFCELVMQLRDFGGLQGPIPGVFVKDSQGAGQGAPTRRQFDGNYWRTLPYHKIDVPRYINPATERVMYISHYGCPARCTFCATPETRKWTPKPFDLVRQDLINLHQIYPFRQINFFDATMFTSKQRVHGVLDCLEDFPAVAWLADARAVELVKYSVEELRLISRRGGGLHSLVVGLESGSARVVEGIMKKGRTHLVSYHESMQRAHQAGIPVTSGLVLGSPGETVADLRETTEFITEIRRIHPPFRLSTTFFRPLPGTELYDVVDAMGLIAQRSFKQWAEAGKATHYAYNQWMDIPWFSAAENRAYQEEYRRFREVHGDILV